VNEYFSLSQVKTVFSTFVSLYQQHIWKHWNYVSSISFNSNSIIMNYVLWESVCVKISTKEHNILTKVTDICLYKKRIRIRDSFSVCMIIAALESNVYSNVNSTVLQ